MGGVFIIIAFTLQMKVSELSFWNIYQRTQCLVFSYRSQLFCVVCLWNIDGPDLYTLCDPTWNVTICHSVRKKNKKWKNKGLI